MAFSGWSCVGSWTEIGGVVSSQSNPGHIRLIVTEVVSFPALFLEPSVWLPARLATAGWRPELFITDKKLVSWAGRGAEFSFHI